jgi:succinate dehydrogenase hydrophobic anchor subunit
MYMYRAFKHLSDVGIKFDKTWVGLHFGRFFSKTHLVTLMMMYLDVLFFHHVQGLRRVVEDAVEHVHHASALAAGLRPELAEQPVEALGLEN